MKNIIALFFLTISSIVSATTFYVATNGNDLWNGRTLSTPWATWQKAFSTANAGDTVYFRGGVYYSTETAYCNPPYIGYSGTRSKPICYFNFPGEKPILDGIRKTSPSAGIGFQEASNIHLKGLTVRNNFQMIKDFAYASGFSISDANNIIIENCVAYNNGRRGFDIHELDTAQIINCDAYNNCDSLIVGYAGGGGDGFVIISYSESSIRSNIVLRGCRAWNNSDDGFDTNSEGCVEYQSCWSFSNGYLDGDGTGFKFGHMNYSRAGTDRRIVNCIAAFNEAYGFDENNGSVPGEEYRHMELEIFNNTSYSNGGGFITYSSAIGPDNNNTYRNNISYNNPNSFSGSYVHSNNSWDANPKITVTDADFLSLDKTQLEMARKEDGSLPEIYFLKLTQGSDLIDAGINVGLPFYGVAPDLGYSEFTPVPVTPPSPVYLSSVIENVSPLKLEMTYSLPLANIVPDPSAFDVKVNSIKRTINSVAVSGFKVLLTLVTPVVFGDLVTVAYSKPFKNPLQTASGGQAATLSPQPVKNNAVPQKPAIRVYPNPAKDLVTIHIDDPGLMPDFIQLVDLKGISILRFDVDPDGREYTIPINLNNSIYILRLGSGKITHFSQKLVVSN